MKLFAHKKNHSNPILKLCSCNIFLKESFWFQKQGYIVARLLEWWLLCTCFGKTLCSFSLWLNASIMVNLMRKTWFYSPHWGIWGNSNNYWVQFLCHWMRLFPTKVHTTNWLVYKFLLTSDTQTIEATQSWTSTFMWPLKREELLSTHGTKPFSIIQSTGPSLLFRSPHVLWSS